ncbi:hypothetical protein PHYBOEH_007919 [Phytophthora boehmeriae]|uniref:Band 7 domain-containing protein n=1 Tax=Phytophthora boehmeriae TaxID=109152 RepID=A0A8T1W4R8_9STRA|nr:hypothetical protein PHYBOEH_007919 [Phytophthora boehmeriae]
MKQMSDMQMLGFKEEINLTKLKRKMMYMEEEQTDAEAALEIAEIEAETVRTEAEINAHCDAEIGLINAEKVAVQLQLQAITDEIRVCANAKAAEIIACAEGEAASKLEAYRKYTLAMKQLDILGALAKNKQTVVSDDTSNSLLSELLVANRQGNIMLNLNAKPDVAAT